MDLRQLTPEIAVAPQIDIEDLPAIAEAGFRVLIINRPDHEVGPDLDSVAMSSAAEAVGLKPFYIPFTPGEITPQMITAFAEALGESGPKLAYCRSGNRSSVLWALTQASKRPTEEIIETAAKAGYDISGVRGLIDAIAS